MSHIQIFVGRFIFLAMALPIEFLGSFLLSLTWLQSKSGHQLVSLRDPLPMSSRIHVFTVRVQKMINMVVSTFQLDEAS